MCKILTKTKDLSKEDWLKLRKQGIGGSDAGAVCGLNPYTSPMDIYSDKTSDTITDIDNEAMKQGRDLEHYVAERFTEATGLKVRRSNAMYVSENHPFMIADVDRLIVGESAGLECKTASPYSTDAEFIGFDKEFVDGSLAEGWTLDDIAEMLYEYESYYDYGIYDLNTEI